MSPPLQWLLLLFMCAMTAQMLSSVNAMKVSLFGDGFISMPLQEAKMSTYIRAKFRTAQENGFLFLAAGRTDYCLMHLEDGAISFTYKIERDVVQLRSPKKQKLNDLEWHDVAMQRYENNITVQVDGTIIRQTLPADMLALNVHFGTFLGGVGDFPAEYLNDLTNFRGCISDVFYNNINIIKRAKERTGHTTSVGVAWTCSNEFDGTVKDSISFLNEDSFALMSKESNAAGESLVMQFRTMEKAGLLFFNGGFDFIMLEIEDECIKLTFNKAGSLVQLSPNQSVADGKWHRITLRYNAAIAELILDDVVFTGRHANETKSSINLEKSVFFGGVAEDIRRRLLNKGLRVNEISFKGCMRGIQVNNVELGFPHMKMSHHLAVHCLWKYPCVEQKPCLKSGTCNQRGVDEFICYCDQSYCIKADFQGPFKIFTETSPELELLYVSPMQLLEGGTVFLSPHFIDVLIDKRQYPSLTDTSIMFHVVQQPKYGQLLQFSAQKNNFVPCQTFNLVDLSTDKVKYVHNGMENFNDHATLDMQVYGDIHKIPENILGKHRFLLHANITPVNDPPQLQVPRNRILRAVEGIEKTLDVDLFNIDDPDSPASALIYTILPTTNTQEAFGRFLVSGISSMTFSQEDVNLGKVTFLYNSTITEAFSYQILLHVSDGIETSETEHLPVSVHPLELRLVNNTGLIMTHKSSLYISPANLSIGTNTADENIDIRYDIVKPPQYGSIQRLRQVDASWVNVDWFSESQLLLGHIRYLHTIDFPWQDEFKFIASFGFVTTQTFDFRITFTRLRINAMKPATIAVNGSREFVLTSDVLTYETVPIGTFTRLIIYKIIKPTKYGAIYVEGSSKFAKEMDSFTQQDIDKNRIRYRTHRTCYSGFTDYLEFIVSVDECDDVAGKLKIMFTPLEEHTDKLTYQKRELLHVQEGDRVLITKNHFEIRFNLYENLQFSVTNAPQHGTLCRYDERELKILPISEFSLEQLFRNDIYYCHDDTESTEDSFDLLILSIDDTDLQFVADVDVRIKLINDNAPYRTVERIFHVVRGGYRTLNTDVLQYLDADVNTNHSDIHYIHVSSTNGAFFKSGIHVDSFSQDDITNRRIIFQHNGPDVGTASFIVTDRQHEVNGLLEIHASDSFVSILPTNASIVQENKFVILRNKDFVLETNLDMKLDEIYYEVLKPPSYGILRYLGRPRSTNDSSVSFGTLNLTSLNSFTHLDIERDRLVYLNTETASMDKVRYRVNIKNITAEGEVLLRIYPPAYWEPLQVIKNQTLYVEESTSILISRDVLEVVHPNISPGDITFLVTSSPMHGYLEMQSMSFDDEYNCKVFDQLAINTEKMFYIQAGVNQSMDYFVFDVTNGITWLRNLMLKIVIIPEKLYMHTNVISVVEGKTVHLSASDIQPFSEYFRGKIVEYIITIAPTSGYIMSGSSKVKRFTQKQLEQASIQYFHNGNENATDVMTVVAMARNKESMPFELEFSITPVNDEQPMVVTNTGLQVWSGGKYIIKYTDLMAQDYDTPAENLTFIVNYIYGGYLAKKSDSKQKIDSFTQAQINSEQIYFIHDATSKRNEMSFMVTDGLFNTTEQLLNIAIRPIEILEERNENLHVFPLTKKQILRDHLLFKCSDEERGIYYNITVPPRMGRVVYEYMEDGYAKEVNSFTQDDIDNGRIFYEHTAVIMEFRINDSFYFDVVADRSDRLLDQKFNVEISVSSGGLLRFLPVSKLEVDEGGSVPINLDFSKITEYLKTRAGITNAELYIEPVQKPLHGSIGLGHEFKPVRRLQPSDFFTKKVYYIHDHTDTLDDTILMSVYLSQYLAQGNIFLCNLTIPVSIKPINDQPFTLLTHLPQMTVVEGENRTITRDILLTEDKDTPPDEIVYDVMSGPTLGVLKKISTDGRAKDLLAYSNNFTQADINNERIVYLHFGTPHSTTFCFTVSDGKFNPAYEIFTIKIAPISLLPANTQMPVYVQQGDTITVMKLDHISLHTNVQPERLSYNISNSPLYGIIIYNHQPTLRFTRDQLKAGEIKYMQTDSTRSNDTFQVSAYVSGTSYTATVDIVVVVEPVIKITNISMNDADGKVRLQSVLVADNPLSFKLNRFNPKFVITRLPATGQIRKIIRSTGLTADTQNERSTSIFSYKELRSGVVYFVPNEAVADTVEDSDSFEYQLLIKTKQTAQATVAIQYRTPQLDNHTVTMASSNFTINYIVLICLLVVLIVCILVAMIVLKYRYMRRDKANISKDQPPPLPCPPDLTSVSPQRHLQHHHHHHYANSEADSVPATAASTPLPGFSNVPHCKIIPVESYKHDYTDYDPDEDETDDQCDVQQMMLPQRYNPYHLENDAWSSSCDMANDFGGYSSVPQSSAPATATPTAPASNPLLRRNQYWV